VISKLRTGDWAIQTFSVIAIVYGSHAMTYAIRDRRQFWAMRPTGLLIASSFADILFISVLANRGIAMSSLSIRVLAFELTAAIVFGILLNFVKIPVFACLQLA
jgi:H+-transporting ATPase